MINGYSYKLWNGKKVIGIKTLFFKLQGLHIVFPSIPLFKQSYFKKVEEIKVPIVYKEVSDNGVQIVLERMLDVSKKSKRQIRILLK